MGVEQSCMDAWLRVLAGYVENNAIIAKLDQSRSEQIRADQSR